MADFMEEVQNAMNRGRRFQKYFIEYGGNKIQPSKIDRITHLEVVNYEATGEDDTVHFKLVIGFGELSPPVELVFLSEQSRAAAEFKINELLTEARVKIISDEFDY